MPTKKKAAKRTQSAPKKEAAKRTASEAPRKRRTRTDSRLAARERAEDGRLPRITYRKAEAAAMLGISRWTLDKRIAEGEILIVDLGPLTVIPATELDRLVGRARRASA
jgi:DNA-binding NtrC family response regulator